MPQVYTRFRRISHDKMQEKTVESTNRPTTVPNCLEYLHEPADASTNSAQWMMQSNLCLNRQSIVLDSGSVGYYRSTPQRPNAPLTISLLTLSKLQSSDSLTPMVNSASYLAVPSQFPRSRFEIFDCPVYATRVAPMILLKAREDDDFIVQDLRQRKTYH